MRGLLRVVAVVLLSFSLGLHWAALQSVAWSSMILNRVQTLTVSEALQTTFDGKHPCPICLVVRDGRTAERQRPASSCPSGTCTPKLELTLASAPIRLVLDRSVALPPAVDWLAFESRSDRPPLPPPRSA